jgi:hypothetical protein
LVRWKDKFFWILVKRAPLADAELLVLRFLQAKIYSQAIFATWSLHNGSIFGHLMITDVRILAFLLLTGMAGGVDAGFTGYGGQGTCSW